MFATLQIDPGSAEEPCTVQEIDTACNRVLFFSIITTIEASERPRTLSSTFPKVPDLVSSLVSTPPRTAGRHRRRFCPE